MELSRAYADQVRKQLGYFPVWQPGDAVTPGDVGPVEHGLFRREAGLSEIFPQLKINVASRRVKGPTQFHSSECSIISLRGSGKVPKHGAIDANIALRLTFGKAGGAVFDALDCTDRYIKNLLAICTYVDTHRRDWPPHFTLATQTTVAKHFVVLVSAEDGASVDLSGRARVLNSWNLADASIKTSAPKNIGYERSGDGAILVGLYGFGWFGKRLKVLSATETMPPEAEFKELPARDPLFD